MKKIKILSFLLAILSVSCSVSSVEDFVVGENFMKDQTGIAMLDTFTLNASTVMFDSIITNSPSRLLIGSNYNRFTGYKSSNAFMEMKFDDDIDYTDFVFDSLCLVMYYDTHYFGDTTVAQTFTVHQLQEEMELNNDNYLYSTSSFAYNNTPLGSITLKPRPTTHKKTNKINIRLDDKLGQRFADMIMNSKRRDTITSQSKFKNFFNGIVIKTQPNIAGATFGIRTSDSGSTDNGTKAEDIETKPEFRLYYHLRPNPDNLKDLYYKFSFYSDGIYFNQISGNNTGSLIEGIEQSDNEKSSTLTENTLIVQSGVQIFSKFKIPYIENLLMLGENTAYIGATLTLYPVKGTYNTVDDLPDSLYVYSANRKNKLSGQITIPGTSDGVYARLTTSSDIEKTVSYIMDVSTFIDNELKSDIQTNLSLMIGYGSTKAKQSADHVMLGAPGSGRYSPKLNVYYYHN
jgi:hypothetical protein